MDSFFLVLVVFLLALAAIDLFVGVSNDAVNFLNSAVGSRISPLGVILFVAGIGVLLGATFSSGMMEVARQGMFHPDRFTFEEIMMIFLAVMITDVLLLNVFNAFGLPTSTTVSIVFELLGAGVCAALYKLNANDIPPSEIFSYIKSERAMTIVSAILASVVVAFFAGMVVQFVCRVLFTFRFKNTYKYLGGIFTGFSVTAIVYFLLMKGARHASFMTYDAIQFIEANTQTIMLTCFLFFTVLAQILIKVGFNVFKIIILSGTFALAFSFAGNDLVNFIGVPLAALDSFLVWSGTGIPSTEFLMGALNEQNTASTPYLLIAGLIMVVTLYTSKKARKVIQTSINLSSSQQGSKEQFGASATGRLVTRAGMSASQAIYAMVPKSMLRFIGGRYRKLPQVRGEQALPFDYVRASVNLVLAAILISSATSLKLPLSTTYVTFMVAMGTSFADGAWDRDSAVYRISGVIAVIAGWFLTAFCAFVACSAVCYLLLAWGHTAAIAFILLAIFLVVRSNLQKAKNEFDDSSAIIDDNDDSKRILANVSGVVPNYFEQNLGSMRSALDNFFADNELSLRKTRARAIRILDRATEERSTYYSLALNGTKENVDAKHFFFLVFSNLRDASKAMRHLLNEAVSHVANRHSIFRGELQESLYDLLRRIETLNADMKLVAKDPNATNVNAIVKHGKKINRDIGKCQMEMVDIIGSGKVSLHSSEMYLEFLQAFRDLANHYVSIAVQEHALSQSIMGHERQMQARMSAIEESYIEDQQGGTLTGEPATVLLSERSDEEQQQTTVRGMDLNPGGK